ncbi:MAG TPA: TldD/PmbA family protein [Jiangellaceae bacterium]|nr:TldD/PmbA family protein [Jiangellaceae bacterium]
MTHPIAAEFLELPLRALADAALTRAGELGAEHADLRVERVRTQSIALRDTRLVGNHESEDLGFAVRVLRNGVWGFASAVALETTQAAQVAERAIGMARVAAPMTSERVELATEPVYSDHTWVSDYEVDPFMVSDEDKIALLTAYSERAGGSSAVSHVTTELTQVLENTFYADLAGTMTTQQRIRSEPVVEALAVDENAGHAETMRTLAAPAARGWEYVTGQDGLVDWSAELDSLGPLLAEKLRAPSVEPGTYDLVIDPSNLWLTIHESVGHATELDRALGYEANYAGTSFATVDQLGSLRYGSPLMHVTGDRETPHALSTIGYDDDGVAAQTWDIVREGRLVGYQLDRAMAHRLADSLGTSRSNGCAFADSPGHIPMQRMANVSLQPATQGPSTPELIAHVDDGIYIVGDKSWSIDMQRYNFQFTGQRFYRIKNGALAGQLRDVAYQATTTDFWGSLRGLGGSQTYHLGGALNCGKGQPGQIAPVSHGCPSALFENIRVLNTDQEGNQP